MRRIIAGRFRRDSQANRVSRGPKRLLDLADGHQTVMEDRRGEHRIRTGGDVFKALALGADAVLVARPYVTAVYGGGAEGVACLTEKLGAELADTMRLCGAAALKDISRDMVRV